MSDFFREICEARKYANHRIDPSVEWQFAFRAGLRTAARLPDIESVPITSQQRGLERFIYCTEEQLANYAEELKREGFTVTEDEVGAYWVHIPEEKIKEEI